MSLEDGGCCRADCLNANLRQKRTRNAILILDGMTVWLVRSEGLCGHALFFTEMPGDAHHIEKIELIWTT